MFARTWTVRFSDTDPFGIAHYPRIVEAIHETSDMFMQDIGFPFWEISQEQGYGLPLVEMDLSFENPVEAGDDVVIELVADPGDRSLTFEYTARCGGELAFSATEVRVCARTDGEGAIEIPADLRAALAAHAPE